MNPDKSVFLFFLPPNIEKQPVNIKQAQIKVHIENVRIFIS